MSLTETQIRALHRAGLTLGQAQRTLAALGVDFDGEPYPRRLVTLTDQAFSGVIAEPVTALSAVLEPGTYLVKMNLLIRQSVGSSSQYDAYIRFWGRASWCSYVFSSNPNVFAEIPSLPGAIAGGGTVKNGAILGEHFVVSLDFAITVLTAGAVNPLFWNYGGTALIKAGSSMTINTAEGV